MTTTTTTTTTLSFETCSDNCGYVAAFVSCIFFGSFAVPMKGEAAKAVDVDPLVFQTYKTLSYFFCSLVLLLWGYELRFSPWGIVSGIFWVPAGSMHILAVRTAGLAIASGTAASMVVLVSFTWGIFVFHERVKSLPSTLVAIMFMIGGIFGMSFFSSPSAKKDDASAPKKKLDSSTTDEEDDAATADAEELLLIKPEPEKYSLERKKGIHSPPPPHSASSAAAAALLLPLKKKSSEESTHGGVTCGTRKKAAAVAKSSDAEDAAAGRVTIIPLSTGFYDEDGDHLPKHRDDDDLYKGKTTSSGSVAMIASCTNDLNRKYKVDVSQRQLGILIAMVGNMWGGSVMVPLHYAGSETKGFNYVFSFAVGSLLVNVVMWILRYGWLYYRCADDDLRLVAAYRALPSFHVHSMVVPGVLSGLMYSMGNFASIVSVTYLGEGLGYSMTQSAMIVSGLWGIFWFKEITTPLAIRGWLASALTALTGILLLCNQHVPHSAPAVLDEVERR